MEILQYYIKCDLKMKFKEKSKINNKGQGSMMSFFTLILGLVMITAFLPIVNELVGSVNNSITAGNMSNLSFGSTIQLLLGMLGLIMILLFLMGVISDFQQRQSYVGA